MTALAACGSSGGSVTDVASLGTTSATSDAVGDASTPDTSTPESIDPEDAFVEYTECMRDQGIDMPDPQIVRADGSASAGGAIAISPQDSGPLTDLAIDFDSDEFSAASKECQPILDSALGEIEIDPELQAEQREQMLAFAQCMRDQGLDYPDPVFSDNGSITMAMGGDEDGAGPINPDSDEWQAAFEACGDTMGGGMAGGMVITNGAED